MKDGNALTCAICIDLVTDIDEFLTSDTTEDQIVQFVEQVHFYLFPLTLLGLRTICLSYTENHSHATIQLCKALGTILPDFEVPHYYFNSFLLTKSIAPTCACKLLVTHYPEFNLNQKTPELVA